MTKRHGASEWEVYLYNEARINMDLARAIRDQNAGKNN